MARKKNIGTITWISVEVQTPQVKEYVLVATQYCKYPCVIGWWNGVDWKYIDGTDEIGNVKYWAYINSPQ
jgi:hypothetical protein